MTGNRYRIGLSSWNAGTRGVMKANAGSFTAGLVPWNTGRRGYMGANATSFAPGCNGEREVLDGTVIHRQEKRGGKERNFRKVGGEWVGNARWVWEQANGPAPAEAVVHHLDDSGDNDAPDNLVVLTRAEHIRIHGPQRAAIERWQNYSGQQAVKDASTTS